MKPKKGWTLTVVLKAVDDNVGNEIIYTAEPCEDVEMNEYFDKC
jgi:hypothetical protein